MPSLQNQKVKILALYILSLVMLAVYWYMDNSTTLNNFLKKANRVRTDSGFGFYVIVGLVKYGLMVAGILTPIILTIFLIRKKLNSN